MTESWLKVVEENGVEWKASSHKPFELYIRKRMSREKKAQQSLRQLILE
jgi:hypothetical protein